MISSHFTMRSCHVSSQHCVTGALNERLLLLRRAAIMFEDDFAVIQSVVFSFVHLFMPAHTHHVTHCHTSPKILAVHRT